MARRPTCCARSMSTMRPERGFALVAAMFVMIVIALVVAAMSRLSVSQTESVDLSLQQARAYQAARAGLEWGIARALAGGNCSDDFVLGGFQVRVSCTESTLSVVEEASGSVRFHHLRATAEAQANLETADYAWRHLETVIEH